MTMLPWRELLDAVSPVRAQPEVTALRTRVDDLRGELAALRADFDTLARMTGRFYQAGWDDAMRQASDDDGRRLRSVPRLPPP